MTICSMIAIADLVADGIDIVHLFCSNAYLYRINYWVRRYISSGDIWVHALALYAAVICYIPYVHPIFYAKHFVNKSQKLHYVVLHISLILWNGCIHFIREQFLIIMPYYLTHIILFITLFIVAVMASIEIYKYKPPGVNATVLGKIRRRRLFSFVIYSYATEFIVLPRFVSSVVSVICAFHRCQIQIMTISQNSVRTMIHIFYEMNSIIICLTTISALEPYRHAILLIFRNQKSSTTRVQPINATKATNVNSIGTNMNWRNMEKPEIARSVSSSDNFIDILNNF